MPSRAKPAIGKAAKSHGGVQVSIVVALGDIGPAFITQDLPDLLPGVFRHLNDQR
jgi:hypothetical protein